MAIYDYACPVCQHEAEVEMPISQSKSTMECPNCKVFSFKRQVSKSTFSLKGGGWYADGYSSVTKKE